MKIRATGDESSCREALKSLSGYLDHELDPALAARISHHLDRCRRCGLEADVYLAIKHSLAHRSHQVDELALRRLRAFAERIDDAADERR